MARSADVPADWNMHVGVAARHPEHVRFFRYPIEELRADGIDVHVYAREHGPTVSLLDHYDLPHTVLAGEGITTTRLVAGHAVYELRLLAAARRANASVLTSIGGLSTTHLAPLVGAQSVAFVDWQPGAVDGMAIRLADVASIPSFLDETAPGLPSVRGRIVRYEGFHELSYLHPERFEPDPDVVRSLGIDPEAPLFVTGFTDPTRRDGLDRPVGTTIRETLSERGTVLGVHEDVSGGDPSAADDLPPTDDSMSVVDGTKSPDDETTLSTAESGSLSTPFTCDGYSAGRRSDGGRTTDESPLNIRTSDSTVDQSLTIPPAARPHVVAHADLCVGDSMTLATEAGLLGTPAVHLPSGRVSERGAALRRRDLLVVATDGPDAVERTTSLVDDPDAGARWNDRRDRYLADAVDVAGLAADILRRESRRGSQ